MIHPQAKALIDTALEMSASGINSGTSGNVSVRTDEGMLITPSGVPYRDLSVENLVAVEKDGSWDPTRTPSSEWRIHHDIYRNTPEAGAIVHAHPRHCTALACLGRRIPAFHYMVAIAGGNDIRCAPYATFGTRELSEHALTALQGRKACLLANHGMVCYHANLQAALSLAIEIEQLAAMYSQCLTLGSPVILTDEEMERVLSRFESYGSSET